MLIGILSTSGRQVAFLFPVNTQGVRCGAECMFVYVLLFVDAYYGAFAAAIGSNTRMCVTNLMRSISNMERSSTPGSKVKKKQPAICFNST